MVRRLRAMLRYWWAHHGTGSSHQAWCNVCSTTIATWSGPAEGSVPAGVRRKLDEHKAEHQHPDLVDAQ